MSLFDLFRGFFGVHGGYYRGDSRRDPFFDGMTHDDDDDEEEDDDEDCFEGSQQQQDPFGKQWRFGFSLGPSGMRVQEPQAFGQIFREMEEIFAGMGSGRFGFPSIEPLLPQDGAERGWRGGGGGGSGTSLRDFMLKSPDCSPPHDPPSAAPRDGDGPPYCTPRIPSAPFHRWTPFSKFNDIFRDGPLRGKERREDGDLDSQVSAGGLDHILTPPPSQPKTRSFFQSVTVTKVVKSDGTVEERRTVRDGQGNEETTVTCSGGQEGPQDSTGPLLPGDSPLLRDMQDSFSLFSSFFGGFKG